MASFPIEELPLEIIKLVFQHLISIQGVEQWRALWRLRSVSRLFAQEVRQAVFDSDLFLSLGNESELPGIRILTDYLDELMNSQKLIGSWLRGIILESARTILQHQRAQWADYDQRLRNMVVLLCEASAKSFKSCPARLLHLKSGAVAPRDPLVHAVVAAVYIGDLQIVKSLLDDRDPTNMYSEVFGPIAMAAARTSLDSMAFLLDQGTFTMQTLHIDGESAIGEAARAGKLETMRLLLKLRLASFMDTTHRFWNHRPSLALLFNSSDYSTSLLQAVKGNQLHVVQFLTADKLSQLAFDHQKRELHSRVLFHACGANRVGIAKAALAEGADPNYSSDWTGRMTPFVKAIVSGASFLELLVEHGARLPPERRRKSASGESGQRRGSGGLASGGRSRETSATYSVALGLEGVQL